MFVLGCERKLMRAFWKRPEADKTNKMDRIGRILAVASVDHGHR
jgi:hypothetical protein